VGRNLEDNGISEYEALLLLKNDVDSTLLEITQNNWRWFTEISFRQRQVIVSMVFNMGMPRFKSFKKMIKALEGAEYKKASQEMLDSLWAKQVGARAIELAGMMRVD